MNSIAEKLLQMISENAEPKVEAFNIRENGKCSKICCSDNIKIVPKENNAGLDITVLPGTKNETVSIPAIVTEGGIDDVARNDFYIGDDCQIVIVSGCGIHTDTDQDSSHDGIHSFHIGKNCHIKYIEKHVGTGIGIGIRAINPIADIEIDENSYLEMDTTQISGVSVAKRKTTAKVAAGSKLVVHERLFTQGIERVHTDFVVELNGEDSKADIVSRTVARDNSYQRFMSTIVGNAKCTGHSECDSIIDNGAIVDSLPRLIAKNKNASLIHEAAIGKIAGEQILKLQTLGLSEEQAENEIINGFLS